MGQIVELQLAFASNGLGFFFCSSRRAGKTPVDWIQESLQLISLPVFYESYGL